jgi:hypothetical protein
MARNDLPYYSAFRVLEEFKARTECQDAPMYINKAGQAIDSWCVEQITKELNKALRAADTLYADLFNLPEDACPEPERKIIPLFGSALRDIHNIVEYILTPDFIRTCNLIQQRRNPGKKPELTPVPLVIVDDFRGPGGEVVIKPVSVSDPMGALQASATPPPAPLPAPAPRPARKRGRRGAQ